ncbi:hypothetical protein Tcan_12171 [Toxocara canis]|uniref:Uncharacterized protein n=1 Tax=Toxocara canis TaxID=6265 RepID=A0A0B2USW5_TOXCA|nr:hypothetical protein Tcan_12171 [Toxocara canis]
MHNKEKSYHSSSSVTVDAPMRSTICEEAVDSCYCWGANNKIVDCKHKLGVQYKDANHRLFVYKRKKTEPTQMASFHAQVISSMRKQQHPIKTISFSDKRNWVTAVKRNDAHQNQRKARLQTVAGSEPNLKLVEVVSCFRNLPREGSSTGLLVLAAIAPAFFAFEMPTLSYCCLALNGP